MALVLPVLAVLLSLATPSASHLPGRAIRMEALGEGSVHLRLPGRLRARDYRQPQLRDLYFREGTFHAIIQETPDAAPHTVEVPELSHRESKAWQQIPKSAHLLLGQVLSTDWPAFKAQIERPVWKMSLERATGGAALYFDGEPIDLKHLDDLRFIPSGDGPEGIWRVTVGRREGPEGTLPPETLWSGNAFTTTPKGGPRTPLEAVEAADKEGWARKLTELLRAAPSARAPSPPPQAQAHLEGERARLDAIDPSGRGTVSLLGPVAGGGRVPVELPLAHCDDIWWQDGLWHATVRAGVSGHPRARTYDFRELRYRPASLHASALPSERPFMIVSASPRFERAPAETPAWSQAQQRHRERIAWLREQFPSPADEDFSGPRVDPHTGEVASHALSSMDITDIHYEGDRFRIEADGEEHTFLDVDPKTNERLLFGATAETVHRLAARRAGLTSILNPRALSPAMTTWAPLVLMSLLAAQLPAEVPGRADRMRALGSGSIRVRLPGHLLAKDYRPPELQDVYHANGHHYAVVREGEGQPQTVPVPALDDPSSKAWNTIPWFAQLLISLGTDATATSQPHARYGIGRHPASDLAPEAAARMDQLWRATSGELLHFKRIVLPQASQSTADNWAVGPEYVRDVRFIPHSGSGWGGEWHITLGLPGVPTTVTESLVAYATMPGATGQVELGSLLLPEDPSQPGGRTISVAQLLRQERLAAPEPPGPPPQPRPIDVVVRGLEPLLEVTYFDSHGLLIPTWRDVKHLTPAPQGFMGSLGGKDVPVELDPRPIREVRSSGRRDVIVLSPRAPKPLTREERMFHLFLNHVVLITPRGAAAPLTFDTFSRDKLLDLYRARDGRLIAVVPDAGTGRETSFEVERVTRDNEVPIDLDFIRPDGAGTHTALKPEVALRLQIAKALDLAGRQLTVIYKNGKRHHEYWDTNMREIRRIGGKLFAIFTSPDLAEARGAPPGQLMAEVESAAFSDGMPLPALVTDYEAPPSPPGLGFPEAPADVFEVLATGSHAPAKLERATAIVRHALRSPQAQARLSAISASEEGTLRFLGPVAGGGRLPAAVPLGACDDLHWEDGLWHAAVRDGEGLTTYTFQRLQHFLESVSGGAAFERVEDVHPRPALERTSEELAAEPEAKKNHRERLAWLRARFPHPAEQDFSGPRLDPISGQIAVHQLSSVDIADIRYAGDRFLLTAAREEHEFLKEDPQTGTPILFGEPGEVHRSSAPPADPLRARRAGRR